MTLGPSARRAEPGDPGAHGRPRAVRGGPEHHAGRVVARDMPGLLMLGHECDLTEVQRGGSNGDDQLIVSGLGFGDSAEPETLRASRRVDDGDHGVKGP